jgi:hypothetical protein
MIQHFAMSQKYMDNLYAEITEKYDLCSKNNSSPGIVDQLKTSIDKSQLLKSDFCKDYMNKVKQKLHNITPFLELHNIFIIFSCNSHQLLTDFIIPEELEILTRPGRLNTFIFSNF